MTNEPPTELSENKATSEEAPDELSAVEKILGVFVAPHSTFKYLSRRPDFWTAFIVLVLAGIAFAMIATPKMIPLQIEAAIEGVQKSPGLTETDKSGAVEMIRKYTPIAAYVGAAVGTPIAAAIMWLLASAVVFFAAMFQGLDTDYKRVLGVLPWTAFPTLFSQALGTVVVSMREFTDVSQALDMRLMRPFSLMGLIPASIGMPKMVEFILGSIDPFYIWGIIITVIALEYANRCKRPQAIITTLVLTVLSLVLQASMAMLGTMGRS
jgi:hypothetical protein